MASNRSRLHLNFKYTEKKKRRSHRLFSVGLQSCVLGPILSSRAHSGRRSSKVLARPSLGCSLTGTNKTNLLKITRI